MPAAALPAGGGWAQPRAWWRWALGSLAALGAQRAGRGAGRARQGAERRRQAALARAPPPFFFLLFASHTGRNEPLAIDPEGRRALTPYDLHDVDREVTRVLPDGCEHENFDQPQALHLAAQRALCFWSNGHLVTHDLASGGASAVKLKQPQGYQIGAFSPGGAVLAACKRFVQSSPLVVLVGNEVSAQKPPTGPGFKPDSLAALDDGTVLAASPGHLDVLCPGSSRRLALPGDMEPAEVVSSDDGRVIARYAVRASVRRGRLVGGRWARPSTGALAPPGSA